jgi:hypothetical protein
MLAFRFGKVQRYKTFLWICSSALASALAHAVSLQQPSTTTNCFTKACQLRPESDAMLVCLCVMIVPIQRATCLWGLGRGARVGMVSQRGLSEDM